MAAAHVNNVFSMLTDYLIDEHRVK